VRVLFVTPPEKKAFHPMVPLAGALHTAGHAVCVAAQAAFTRTISYAGLTAVPLGDDVVQFAEYWRPDLVVGNSSAAARAVGAAHAQLSWQSGGTTVAHFTVEQLPPTLRAAAAGHTVELRHTPYAGPVLIPPWLWPPPRRPRVALVPGNGTLAGLTESLVDLDVEIVATSTNPRQHRIFPDNVRVGTSVPLGTLVSTCAAVIHDGSPDMVATTALYGVPQLALPSATGQLATRISASGVGLHIDAEERGGQQVRTALLRLLDERDFADQAARVRGEVLAMPTANALVPHLEELTEKYRTRPPA
jgi:UDP:flavonoid glycosyltransferase YjiC (YdhE family)